jgi:hypothetical protein
MDSDVDAPPGLSLDLQLSKASLELSKMLLNLPSELLRATLEYVRKSFKLPKFRRIAGRP